MRCTPIPIATSPASSIIDPISQNAGVRKASGTLRPLRLAGPASVTSPPSDSKPMSEGRVRISNSVIGTVRRITHPMLKNAVRQSQLTTIQLVTGTITIAPRPVPVIAMPSALPRLTSNQLLITSEIGMIVAAAWPTPDRTNIA